MLIFLLGTNNIVGVKTGNSDEAGGVFISASKIILNNKPVTIVTALVNTPDLYSAVQGSLPLVRSAQANFSIVTALRKGAVVAQYDQPWGDKRLVTLSNNVSYTAWNGANTSAKITKKDLKPNSSNNTKIGDVTVSASPFSPKITVPLEIKQPITKPGLTWRLTHPVN